MKKSNSTQLFSYRNHLLSITCSDVTLCLPWFIHAKFNFSITKIQEEATCRLEEFAWKQKPFIVPSPKMKTNWNFILSWCARQCKIAIGVQKGDRNNCRLCTREGYIALETKEMRKTLDKSRESDFYPFMSVSQSAWKTGQELRIILAWFGCFNPWYR